MFQPKRIPQGLLAVTEIEDAAAFAALEVEWDALASRTDDQPFFRHAFLKRWLEHFASGGRLRILTARDEKGRLVAALPLVLRRGRFLGVPMRQLASASNAHSCRFELLADDPRAAAHAFLSHLERTGGWDLLQLFDVPEGGAGAALFEVANERGFPLGRTASLRSPFVRLPRAFTAFIGSLDPRFRANLRRRRRRLEEKGEVTFELFTGGPGLDARLEEGFALEASGWKGEGGTAIAQSEATRGFYTALAHDAAARSGLALLFLRLDGRAIAFHFALVHGGRYLLLKPAYDEALRECSPGQLLMEEAFRAAMALGLSELDFLGPDMPWKRDWAKDVRPHATLFVFRKGALGRTLATLRFRVAPLVKRKLVGALKRRRTGTATEAGGGTT